MRFQALGSYSEAERELSHPLEVSITMMCMNNNKRKEYMPCMFCFRKQRSTILFRKMSILH